jgi:hypothetical protein
VRPSTLFDCIGKLLKRCAHDVRLRTIIDNPKRGFVDAMLLHALNNPTLGVRVLINSKFANLIPQCSVIHFLHRAGRAGTQGTVDSFDYKY